MKVKIETLVTIVTSVMLTDFDELNTVYRKLFDKTNKEPTNILQMSADLQKLREPLIAEFPILARASEELEHTISSNPPGTEVLEGFSKYISALQQDLGKEVEINDYLISKFPTPVDLAGRISTILNGVLINGENILGAKSIKEEYETVTLTYYDPESDKKAQYEFTVERTK